MLTDEEVRARYGAAAIISRTGRFVLVHLDTPSDETVRRRTRQFDPDVYFEADCPLCAIQRSQGVFVFDHYPDDEENILID
jgi:hypothetical protein